MSVTAVRQLRAVVLLTLLGLALVHAGLPATAAGAGKKEPTPTLLWKTYPLRERPTGRDRATINRGPRILSQRTAEGEARGKSAAPRSLAMILWLSLGALFLGIAALPEMAFPNPKFADFFARRRVSLTLVGVAALLGAVIALALG